MNSKTAKTIRYEPIAKAMVRFAKLSEQGQMAVLERVEELDDYAYRKIKDAIAKYGELPVGQATLPAKNA
jgi:hypothetical protein